MSKQRYESILRVVACITAIMMFWISAQFSVNGFNIIVPERIYIGWMLAMAVIVIELVWNRVGDSSGITLFVAGLLSYVYGIYTSITGIMEISNLVNTTGVGEVVAASILGVFLEVVPEPLFLWGLIGTASDPISHLLQGKQRHGYTKPNKATILGGLTPDLDALRQFNRERNPRKFDPSILSRFPKEKETNHEPS